MSPPHSLARTPASAFFRKGFAVGASGMSPLSLDSLDAIAFFWPGSVSLTTIGHAPKNKPHTASPLLLAAVLPRAGRTACAVARATGTGAGGETGQGTL
ncbi:hypothetical protein [Olivibacter sitiensis]|uniref:hypothetical protein n=1 Tax=Olivibacter sitiensis TaxID=376470 RepID=UPI0003FEFA08|nr:hypothetical protein [Olivibacter sitiensis]